MLRFELRKSRAKMFVQTKKDCKNVIMISVSLFLNQNTKDMNFKFGRKKIRMYFLTTSSKSFQI